MWGDGLTFVNGWIIGCVTFDGVGRFLSVITVPLRTRSHGRLVCYLILEMPGV